MRRNSVRNKARDVLGALLAPLAKHALLSGVSAREVQALWRIAVVREAAKGQKVSSSRINIAGISAATGMSRSDIARILKELESDSYAAPVTKPHSINKVLAAWNSNPYFTNKNGRPKQLRIYGPGYTFESLVKNNAGGLPTRAVLDELIRLGSVNVIQAKNVKLKSAVPRSVTDTTEESERLILQVSQLLDGVFLSVRSIQGGLSISSIDGEIYDGAKLPIFRKQVYSGSEDLLTELRESFVGASTGKVDGAGLDFRHQVRVAVIYQELTSSYEQQKMQTRRKNFRRNEP